MGGAAAGETPRARRDAIARDKHGSIPLRQASPEGDMAVADILLDYGTDASAQDDDGSAPLPSGAVRGTCRPCRIPS